MSDIPMPGVFEFTRPGQPNFSRNIVSEQMRTNAESGHTGKLLQKPSVWSVYYLVYLGMQGSGQTPSGLLGTGPQPIGQTMKISEPEHSYVIHGKNCGTPVY